MSRKYKIADQESLYFVTLTIVSWIDLFIRNEYRELILDSIKYCQANKGLRVFAWCIMTSHIHLIIGTTDKPMQHIIRDLKRHTSIALRKSINDNPQESRKHWLQWMMQQAGKHNSNNIDWQLWQQHNHPIELTNGNILLQKLNYIHNNPVQAGFVNDAEAFTYSSAADYSGSKGLLDIEVLDLYSI